MKTLSIITLSIMLLAGCNQTKSIDVKTNSKEVSEAKEVIPVLESDTLFSFSNYELGKIPKGGSEYFTGRGSTTEWKVVDDNGTKVLAQLSADNPNYHFNEIVFDGFKIKNVELSVKLKGVDGQMDQGGGFVWRFIDVDNYYVVRANPLEDNVVLYKVKNGIRKDLPLVGKGRTYGTDVEPLGSGWNDLKLTVVEDLFTVYLNDKEIFKVKDETFTKAGKVGFWTKADAVTYFKEFYINPLSK